MLLLSKLNCIKKDFEALYFKRKVKLYTKIKKKNLAKYVDAIFSPTIERYIIEKEKEPLNALRM